MKTKDQTEPVDDTVNALRSSAHKVVDNVAEVSTHAIDVLNQQSRQAKKAEQRMVKNCRGYLHENPVTALGIAVGVGFLLSRLLSGR